MSESWDIIAMRDRLSWKCTFLVRRFYVSVQLSLSPKTTCFERPHFYGQAKWHGLQDKFYCICICPTPTFRIFVWSRQVRKQRDEEMGADRQLSKNLIQKWKDIKSQRQFQKFTNTAVKLLIKKWVRNCGASCRKCQENSCNTAVIELT